MRSRQGWLPTIAFAGGVESRCFPFRKIGPAEHAHGPQRDTPPLSCQLFPGNVLVEAVDGHWGC